MSDVDLSDIQLSESPLQVVATVIDELQLLKVDLPEDSGVVGFGIDNNQGGFCEAVAEYMPSTGIVQMTVSLTYGQVRKELIPGLLQLLNQLNLMMPSVSFTYDEDDDEGDEIEISISCFALSESELANQIKFMIAYLVQVLKNALPAIYTYVSQKFIVHANTDGVVSGPRLSTGVRECLALVEFGNFGRA